MVHILHGIYRAPLLVRDATQGKLEDPSAYIQATGQILINDCSSLVCAESGTKLSQLGIYLGTDTKRYLPDYLTIQSAIQGQLFNVANPSALYRIFDQFSGHWSNIGLFLPVIYLDLPKSRLGKQLPCL